METFNKNKKFKSDTLMRLYNTTKFKFCSDIKLGALVEVEQVHLDGSTKPAAWITEDVKYIAYGDENEVYFIPQINFYTVKNEYKYLKPFKEEDFEILKKIEINSKQLIELFPKKQLRTCCALTGKSDL